MKIIDTFSKIVQMKKYLFLFLGLTLVISSCSTEDAEKAADEFHAKLNEGEIDYIMDNLVSIDESAVEDVEAFRYALEIAHSQGTHENREKSSGFNKSYNNGQTTVKLNYTFTTGGQKIYERLVMVKTDEGYKVLVFAMNPDEAVVEEYTSNY